MTVIRRKNGMLTIRLHHKLWRINRLIAKFDGWRCKRRRQHFTTTCDWGYGMNGMIDLYCPNCLQVVDRIPLDDFNGIDSVLDAIDKARSV